MGGARIGISKRGSGLGRERRGMLRYLAWERELRSSLAHGFSLGRKRRCSVSQRKGVPVLSSRGGSSGDLALEQTVINCT